MQRTAARVLRGARKVLTTTGWVKGDDHRVEDGQSKFCARGAVQVAAGARIVTNFEVGPYDGTPRTWHKVDTSELDNAAYSEAMAALNRVAAKKYKDEVGEHARCDIVRYNDVPGHTLDDVLDTFDQAIALAEAEATVALFI